MLRKKIVALASASVLVLSVAAIAGGPSMEPMPAQSESGFTLGMNYANQLGNDFVLMAGYINDNFLADFGANYNQYSLGSVNPHTWELRGDLGLRNQLVDTLYLTYGAMGSYGVLSKTTPSLSNPYTEGAFVGLDYQPMNHLLLSLKVSPYTYLSKPYLNAAGTQGLTRTGSNVFSDGSIGASYIFS